MDVGVRQGSISILDELAEEWRNLCSRAANNEPFYRPEWYRAWLRAFAPESTVLLLAARAGGRLVAVLPLVVHRTLVGGLPARLAASPTNHHSCRFDLLREAGPDGDAAVGGIWQALLQSAKWDCLQWMYVPEGGALEQVRDLAAAAGCPVWTREAWSSPYIVAEGWDGTPDYWLRQTTTKFARNVRRLTKKCAGEAPIRLERVDNADQKALDKFFEIETSGWKGESGTGIAGNPATLQFYSEVAREAAAFGYGAVYLLYLGGTVAAGHFGFRYNGKYLAAKCAFDERFRPLSPGHLVVDGILKDCGESKFREFDFCGEYEEWKAKWTSKVRGHSTLFIFRNNGYGRLLHQLRTRLVPAAGKTLRRMRQAAAQWRGTQKDSSRPAGPETTKEHQEGSS